MSATDAHRPIQRVGSVGGGVMGSGIAEVGAKADLDTLLVEVTKAAAARGGARLEASVELAVSRRKSIPIVEFAAATGDGAMRVLGLHFFNPALP